MADVLIWKNVDVSMESERATAKTISAITQANPPVVTASAHGFTDGDYVYFRVNGMSKMDYRVCRVANSDTNTFEAEGVDASEYKAFTSGTVAKLTMGNSITTITDVSASGGDFNMIDTTTIHDDVSTEVPGLPSATSYSCTHIWDLSDPGQIAMNTAYENQTIKAFMFQFGSGGKIMVFSGYVGFNGMPGGQAQDKLTCTGVFTVKGKPTYYAS